MTPFFNTQQHLPNCSLAAITLVDYMLRSVACGVPAAISVAFSREATIARSSVFCVRQQGKFATLQLHFHKEATGKLCWLSYFRSLSLKR